ncbi:zinc-dependent alcohol dehydrogenase [Kribbella sp. CA-245084]|uniref:zinc-dependent alcohol dehydrogenase n=1 Tax=Kribbella sp. CA-245084 TaxID=3239940 RepID=UPI003D8D2D23
MVISSGPGMRALVLEEFDRMVLSDRPVPEPGPEEVLVRVLATGICGSDVHGFTGETGRRIPGQVMGHETVGVIASLCAEAAGLSVGDVVVLNPTLACGSCPRCRQGRTNICATRKVIGVDPAISSAFADYFAAPADNLVPFHGEQLHGALVEPLAVGFHAARRGEVSDGDHVLVLGGGPIGQAAALASHRLGAATVTVSEPVPARRSLLTELGFRVLDPAADDIAAAMHAVTGTAGSDVVIDAVGSGVTVRTAVSATAVGGRCVLVGMAAPRLELDAFAVSTADRSIIGAFCYSTDEFSSTARWAEENPQLLGKLISELVSPVRAPKLFTTLASGDGPPGKVLVDFS